MAYETDDPELAQLRALLLLLADNLGAVVHRLEWAAEVLNVSPTETPLRRLACLREAQNAIKNAERRLESISVEEVRSQIARLVEEER